MIEAGAAEVSDDKMFEAIMLAHEEIKKLCAFIEDIQAQIGKPKFSYPSAEIPKELLLSLIHI